MMVASLNQEWADGLGSTRKIHRLLLHSGARGNRARARWLWGGFCFMHECFCHCVAPGRGLVGSCFSTEIPKIS